MKWHVAKNALICTLFLLLPKHVFSNLCAEGTYGPCYRVSGNPRHPEYNYGECPTYDPFTGNGNNYYCVSDGVCSNCCIECSNKCPQQCTACPAGKTSPYGSTTVDQCVVASADCGAGYTGPAGACTACAAGKYKAVTGDIACTDCSSNSYSTATAATDVGTCQTCPSNTQSVAGSGTLASCVCNPGYTGPDGQVCSACAAGKYKSGIGSIACTDCSSNFYSTATAATNVNTCQTCPSNTQSVAGSGTLVSCVCNPGYTGPDGQICSACAAA
jgi:hypothetical protein